MASPGVVALDNEPIGHFTSVTTDRLKFEIDERYGSIQDVLTYATENGMTLSLIPDLEYGLDD